MLEGESAEDFEREEESSQSEEVTRTGERIFRGSLAAEFLDTPFVP